MSMSWGDDRERAVDAQKWSARRGSTPINNGASRGTQSGESKPGRVGRDGGGFARPDPRAITFSFSACTVLEFMPDGELMRDRFVVITRRRRRRDGKTRGNERRRARRRNKEPKTEKDDDKGWGGKGSTGGDAERETDKEGGGGARRFRRASEAWPGKAVRHSGNDGGGSEPITYYNCLASERSERGAPVRHPSSRRMASLPITSAVIANFSRPCLLLASRCRCCAPFTTLPPAPNPSLLPSSWSPPSPPLLVCINFLAEVTLREDLCHRRGVKVGERSPSISASFTKKWRWRDPSYAIRTGNNMLATLHPEEIIQRAITIKRIRSARKTRHDPCLVIDGFKRAMAIARLVFDTCSFLPFLPPTSSADPPSSSFSLHCLYLFICLPLFLSFRYLQRERAVSPTYLRSSGTGGTRMIQQQRISTAGQLGWAYGRSYLCSQADSWSDSWRITVIACLWSLTSSWSHNYPAWRPIPSAGPTREQVLVRSRQFAARHRSREPHSRQLRSAGESCDSAPRVRAGAGAGV
ncbi:hypothetical protein DBV15_07592 [Temnothorax longispinosus]|uniref:Uncharacterized protein n=1 Tax=Temnothorax longispinosus TaxID=300112 RepID=A0A4S2L4K4_9HYME|nr:hypothetical protein DBV15_07592 [Temnothorax longispinosus]